jgi:hypothetical protein
MRPALDDPTMIGADLAANTASLAARLAGAQVVDLVTLDQAVQDRQQIADAQKRVTEFFRPLKAAAHHAWKLLCEREAAVLAPLTERDTELRTGISAYKAAADRQRREQERALADAARIERDRVAAAEAAAHEAAGEHDLGAMVLADAIAAPPPVVVLPDATKAIAGLKFTRRWLWRFVPNFSLAMLPAEFLMADEKKIASYVRSMKGSGHISGVEIYYTDDPVR